MNYSLPELDGKRDRALLKGLQECNELCLDVCCVEAEPDERGLCTRRDDHRGPCSCGGTR